VEGKLHWQGDSDAQITKGLLALLIEGLEGLSPNQVVAIDPAFIAATGLQASLTPSRANGFLNILRAMQAQAAALVAGPMAAEDAREAPSPGDWASPEGGGKG
jgi:cysteine desulfuration protein SufE